MIAFHSILPEIAQRETRSIHYRPEEGLLFDDGLPESEYEFVEFYCEDPSCDCRRVLIQIVARNERNKVLATINYGWEQQSFYHSRMPYDPEAARQIVRGVLDPINKQSEHSLKLLKLFQETVEDSRYRELLDRHYSMCRKAIAGNLTKAKTPDGTENSEAPSTPSDAILTRIPTAHRDRFTEVFALLEQFGRQHLDVELTSFLIELWKKICSKKDSTCLRGQTAVWAAAVTHVIARMNFLFDRGQPVHLTFDTICDFFQVKKATIGTKATEIERMLRLRQHCEPGLCRKKFVEDFTNVRLSNGLVVSWSMAKKVGVVPPDADIEEFLKKR